MPPFEYSHPNKFRASIGLALIVSAFSLPIFVLRPEFLSRVTSREIADLPPRVANAIDNQTYMADVFISLWPIFSFTLFCLGVYNLLIGLRRWETLSREQDKLEMEKLRDENKLRRDYMNERDWERKLAEETAESLGLVKEFTPLFTHPPSRTNGHGGLYTHSFETAPDENTRAQQLTTGARISKVEQLIGRQLRNAFSSEYVVRPGVKMSVGTGRVHYLDFNLQPPEDSSRVELAVEVKYIQDYRNMVQSYSDFLQPLFKNFSDLTPALKNGTVYTGKRGKPPKACANCVVIFVLDQDRIPESNWLSTTSYLTGLAEHLNSEVVNPTGTIVVPSQFLEELDSERLILAFRRVLTDPYSTEVVE